MGKTRFSPNLVLGELHPFFQATIGDVQGEEPGLFKTEARAKWEAWAALQGMSRQQAMQGYVSLMGDPEGWENHELLKNVYPATPPRQS